MLGQGVGLCPYVKIPEDALAGQCSGQVSVLSGTEWRTE